jgi:holliday junction DNA helicase RuvB
VARYPEVVAALIRRGITSASIRTHERVLFRRFAFNEAKLICERLLEDGHEVTIDLPEDDGSYRPWQMRAASLEGGNGARVDLLPFLVTSEPGSNSQQWIGSRGFASRLRTSFQYGAEASVVRILLLFDEHPVETEETTASDRLGKALVSIESLRHWISSPGWKDGYSLAVWELAGQVLDWWESQISDDAREESITDLMERAAAFLDVCRLVTNTEDVGWRLPSLDLLFSDPELTQAQKPELRLSENSELARQLDAIRLKQVTDPILEADRILDIGSAGEPFFDALAEALRDTRAPISEAGLTLTEIQEKLRKRDRVPAWLDVSRLEAIAVDAAGNPVGSALAWRLNGDFSSPQGGGEVQEVVLACSTGTVRLRMPIEGDLNSYLYQDGTFVSDLGDGKESLHKDDDSFTRDFSVPEQFGVAQLELRGRRPAPGRPPRATQIIRLGIFRGDRYALPRDAWLDPDSGAFVVDQLADSIPVEVGGREINVDENLPDGDQPQSVQVAGVYFTWMGEDRSPDDDPHPDPKREVRLLTDLGVKSGTDPWAFDPVYLDDGSLTTHSAGKSALLDVPPHWLDDEALLLREPKSFAGPLADMEAAISLLTPLVEPELVAWLTARETFFDAVRDHCAVRIPQQGYERPTMYLADLRDEDLASLAWNYVRSYEDVLSAAVEQTRGNSNPALIEPLLFCDRAPDERDALRIAPSHPTAVAFLATTQRGVIGDNRGTEADGEAILNLLHRPLLAGVLPWVRWRGRVLDSVQHGPLLWRSYGTHGGSLDTSQDLLPVIVQKVKRLLRLAPHVNHPERRLYLNVEVGRGKGEYVLQALEQLQSDREIKCGFDVGLVANGSQDATALEKLFSDPVGVFGEGEQFLLGGFVRVCSLADLHERDAHLVFRMEGAESEKQPMATISESHPLTRTTGFAAGLAQEPARFATIGANEVTYTRYVSGNDGLVESLPPEDRDTLWSGRWRKAYLRLTRLSREAAIGLHSAVQPNQTIAQSIRQIADDRGVAEYDRSFITVHCDPAQGPEFFVGERSARSGVFLVESSDLGAPELPGRDVVSVTSRIGPFRAALATAVATLPDSLSDLVNPTVARGLLRDINLLRGTEVFDFLRETSREAGYPYFMDGLDNVLALRYLLSPTITQADSRLPLVVSMKDFVGRIQWLRDVRRGIKCDDIIVFYIPRPTYNSAPVIRYRLIEVKFGPRNQQRAKAEKQLSATGQKLRDLLPPGIWAQDPAPVMLLLERDIAWTVHEALERYRAFDVLAGTPVELEQAWDFKRLFRCLHAGQFRLEPWRGSGRDAERELNGTALFLDPTIPGTAVRSETIGAAEQVTLPRDLIAELLVSPVAQLSWGEEQTASATGSTVEPASEQRLNQSEELEEEADDRPAPLDVGEEEEPEAVEIAQIQGGSESGAITEPEVVEGVEGVSTRPEAEPGDEARRMQQEVRRGFDGFIGNTGVVARLERSMTVARLEGKKSLDPVGLFGPKSTGKTELAKRISKLLGVPKEELSETTLRSGDDLALKFREVADRANLAIRVRDTEHGATVLEVPPMVVFIDEVHLLRRRVQDSLLKAMEPTDRTLISSAGVFDTSKVTFIIATTDPGDLGSAFMSRVSRYNLREYDESEIIDILAAHIARDQDIPEVANEFHPEVLRIFARVGRRTPRRALELMKEAARERHVGLLSGDIENIRNHYRDLIGADDLGLVERDREYLRALFPDHVAGLDALAALLGEGTSTVANDLEPYLLRLGLIERTPSGRKLSQQGREWVAAMDD